MSPEDEPTFGLTPRDVERALRFVRSIRWQAARTTPGDEHEYSLPDWWGHIPGRIRGAGEYEREWFVDLIAEHGYRETFQARGPALAGASGSRWRYLELGDGYRYWCSKVWSDENERRPMLNRAKVEPAPEPAQMSLEVDR